MEREIQLDGLKAGQSATVHHLAADGAMRRRLQDMGVIEGTRIECVGVSPLGDPAAYLIRGAVVALRRKDAAGILCGEVSPASVQHDAGHTVCQQMQTAKRPAAN